MKRLMFLALAGAALLVSIRYAAAQAPNTDVRLILSSRPLNKAPRTDERSNVLRPSIEQELLTYVQHDGAKAQNVRVQVLADGVEVATSKSQPVDPGKPVLIAWPRAAATPGAKPTEWTRPVVIRLLDDKGNPLGEGKKLIVDRPDNYLDAKLRFIPRRSGEPNRLIATITPKENFKGPPCRVQLVLDPERIPGLDAGQRKNGAYTGSVTSEKNSEGEFKSLYLSAEDIRFKSDERLPSGVVTIRADGYNRAFAFPTEFPPSGTPSSPVKRGGETLRLNLPRFADPSNPVSVVVEADNLLEREDARLVLDAAPMLADKNEPAKEQFSALEEFRGERNVQLFFRGGGKNGGLLIFPEVKDWSKSIDPRSLYGSVKLRLRLLGKDGTERQVINGETGKPTTEVSKTLVMDDTPPDVSHLEPVSPRFVRGKRMVVRAQGFDDESGIREVVFFVGKRPANDPLSPDAITRPGKQKPGSSTWDAELMVPSDARSPLDVFVRFTNNVGLSKTEAIALEVTDPPPPALTAATAKKGSIAGVVMEGERPQKGLNVDLLDPAGKVLLSTKTAENGTFLFKDLLPGGYRVSSVKTSSNTRGLEPPATGVPIPLAAGEDKKGIVVKLWR